jgi:alpha-1,4-digalacturonate transport system substrate-binding protein
VPKLQDQAVGLNVHPFAFAYYRNSANRIAQYLTDELTLDEALQRLQQDINDAIAEATGQAVETPPEKPPLEAAELRFTYYADGKEAEVMQPILDKFMAENPAVTVILDVVPYATIDEQLPVQVETGEGPDLARITNFAAFQGKLLDLEPLLSDPAYFEANFPAPVLAAMRAEGATSGLHGFPDALTVTGPFVNKTLFDQAGIELPGEGTTWEEWTELTKQVAEATGVQYAISIDRTGHRFAGPAMSMGATLIDADGNFTVDTAGFRAFAELLNSWHEEGITPSEVWLVGDSLNNCIDYVISGDLVMCMTGSWQVGRMAADVGDAFDWVVVPNPTGAGGSTGVAGGSAVVAFADTEHPEAVAALMEFLIQPENYGAFSAGTLALPAQTDVASQGVAFETDDAAVLAALAAYTAEVPKLQDQAVGLNVHPFAFAYYRNSANRIAQYLTDELTLDEALQRLQQDIDDAIAEATP